jgi:hypothetical protein
MVNIESSAATAHTGWQTRRPRPGELAPGRDVVEYLKEYAREKPEAAALWCLAIGFILGWKLKPW